MTNPLNILLIEDDDVAAESVQRSLRKHGVNFPVTWVEDGLAALHILRNLNPEKTIKRPLVILLDLNMPRMNGFEFLHELRNDADLKSHVVFVLTTSESDADMTQAYHHNIAGYMVKSAIGPQFSRLVSLLSEYQETIRLL